jgi:hypothetical protein
MENPSSGPGFPSWYRFNNVLRCYFFFFAAFFLAFFLAGIQSHLHSFVWVHGLRVNEIERRVKWKFHFIENIFSPPSSFIDSVQPPTTCWMRVGEE